MGLEKGLGSVYLITGSKLAYFFEESSMSINFLAPETIHIMALKIKGNRIYSLLLTHHYLRSGPWQPVSGWGGVFPNLGPLPFQVPPPKKISGKQNFFPENVGDRVVDVIFLENKSSRNLSQSTIFSEEIFIFKTFCNSSMPGPPPRKLGPPILLLGGGVLQPDLLPSARPCLRLIVDDHSYSGHGLSG